MADETSGKRERVRTLEVVATLSLATDLSIGVPLEHGLRSALIARRLCDEVHADQQEATEAFYAALLFYIGCTGTALTASRIFGDDAALTNVRHSRPVRSSSPTSGGAGARSSTTRAASVQAGDSAGW